MSVRASILGPFRVGRGLAAVGWIATGVMGIASIVFIIGSA